MGKYTIYCTEEQTKKALELGAPIAQTHANPSMSFVYRHPMRIWVSTDDSKIDVGYVLGIPTAEQMINWLEKQGDINVIEVGRAFKWSYRIFNKEHWEIMKHNTIYTTRKEASLAAIDAALDYLKKMKK